MKLSLIGSIGYAVALGNTAPFLLISGTKGVPKLNANKIGAVESALSEELAECKYDSYIFAQMNGVTERSINSDTMPELSHLLAKAAGYHHLPAVQDFDQYKAHAEETVRAKCGAADVEVASDGSYELYQNSEPHIFEVDLGSDPATADSTLSHIVGHLASSNFVIVLRSTPPGEGQVDASAKAATPSSGTAAAKRSSNLFTDYVFFSPGLFMAIIVTALIGSVTLIALGWLQSLLVSYKAFEKQPEKSS